MTGGRAVRWRSWACLRCAGGGAIRWATEIDGDPAAEGPGGSLLLIRGERLYMTEKHVARQPSLAGALLLTKAHPPQMASRVAQAIAMYSNSADDAATDFLNEVQLTGAPQDMKTQPPRLYCCSVSLAQSESV